MPEVPLDSASNSPSNKALPDSVEVIDAVGKSIKSAISSRKLELDSNTRRFLELSQGSGSMEELMANLTEIGEVLDIQRFILYAISGNTATILMIFSQLDDRETIGQSFPLDSNPNIKSAVETGKISQIPVPGIGIDAAFPLGVNGVIVGVDNTHAAREFTKEEIIVLKFVASSIVSAYDGGHSMSELAQDRLTQLGNRFAFDTAIDKGLDIFKKELPTIETVAFLDIDYFKAVNDNYGHAVGDAVLRHVGAVLRDKIASLGGSAFRYGGEEFVAIFPKELSYEDLDSIRLAISSSPCVFHDMTIPVTISIGFSRRRELLEEVPKKRPGYLPAQRMVYTADTAVYIAKEYGRNVTAKATENDNLGKKSEKPPLKPTFSKYVNGLKKIWKFITAKH